MNIEIISFLISIIALSASLFAIILNRSRLEVSIYKNISDTLLKLYDFAAKELDVKNKYGYASEEMRHFKKIKRYYKIEVLNHIEHACRKFLDGHISEKSFRDYYLTYLDSWVDNIPQLKSSPYTFEFEDIITVHKILKNKITKPRKFMYSFIVWISLISIYIILMFNCFSFCFCNKM